MTRAYVLLKVRPGKNKEVVTEVLQVKGVKQAHACWGIPDVFTYVEISDERALSQLILGEIQRIDGVLASETHIVAET